MSNSTFTTAAAGTPPPDPSKHVNYIQGMVLRDEDFKQDFAYVTNRYRWYARDAIGYGTVCGLHVSFDPADHNSISVSPGVAINPRGELIRVAPRQCAKLDAWLALPDTVKQMTELGIGATGPFTAYVVLCYRDCPTDEVPVPGEPCRCDSDTMAASRIVDDFRLELTLEPPPQLEEDAIRDLVSWLRGVEIADFNPAPGDLEAFLQAIKDAVAGDSPPQSPPDFFVGSPPAGLRIPRHLLCEWMRAVLRLWVTELRPLWQAQCAPQKSCACGGPCGCHGSGAQPDNMACACLLLAAVRIRRGSSGGITDAELDEERRPFLVHLRMLQELLFCGPSCCDSCGDARTFATVFALDQDTLQIWIHHPVQLSVPEAAVTLQLGGVTITDFTISPSVSPPGLNLFDLTLSGSPVDIMGNSITIGLQFDANLILEPDGRSLAAAIWQDRYCYGDYVEPRLSVFAASGTLTLGGDVVGPPAHNQLAAIHGEPLNLTGLGNKQALGHDNNEWHPVPVPQPATAPPVPETFGVVGSVGSNPLVYALANHRHAMPPDPVPPHNIDAAAHRNLRLGSASPPIAPAIALSDVRGNAEHNIVVGLQRVPVSDIPLGAGQNGFVLTYRSGPNQWVAERSAFRITSGLVIFEEVALGQRRVSPPIAHGFKDQLVMIRLGLEWKNVDYVEDLDSPFLRDVLDQEVPRMFVQSPNSKKDFVICIQDMRRQGDAQEWRIRWWAVPVTQQFDEAVTVLKGQNEVSRDIIIAMASLGLTVPNIATKLGVTEAKVRPVVKELESEGAIRIARNRILPPA